MPIPRVIDRDGMIPHSQDVRSNNKNLIVYLAHHVPYRPCTDHPPGEYRLA